MKEEGGGRREEGGGRREEGGGRREEGGERREEEEEEEEEEEHTLAYHLKERFQQIIPFFSFSLPKTFNRLWTKQKAS